MCLRKVSLGSTASVRTMTISGESSGELNKCGRMACFLEKLTASQMLSVRGVHSRTVKPGPPLRPTLTYLFPLQLAHLTALALGSTHHPCVL